MEKLFEALKKHPAQYIIAACSHILLILLVVYSVCTNLFNIFTPSDFTSEMSSSDSNTTIEDMYKNGTRFIKCEAPTLYYSGYDMTSSNKVTGHYYYSLDNSSCTIYLLSSNLFDNNDSVPTSISDLKFNARLNRSDASIKSLLKYMSADIDWNYYSLSKCTGTIIIDQSGYSTAKAISCLTLILVLIFLNIMQILNIKYKLFSTHVSQ